MNPTVEDTADENNHVPEPESANAGDAPPWPEIFARHNIMLATHLELLRSVKTHVAPDDEALRSVSTMVGKTVQAMDQCKLLRKQMLSKRAVDNASTSKTSSSTSHSGSSSNMNQRHIPQSADTGTSSASNTNGERRKRSRTEKEKESDSAIDTRLNHNSQSDSGTETESRASKRKREALFSPGHDEDVDSIIPISLETEDISAEVQRRLQIMEERRRKKETAQQSEKRKRESMASNESLSSAGGSSSGIRPKKKRARLEVIAVANDELKRRGDSVEEVEKEADVSARKQRKISRDFL